MKPAFNLQSTQPNTKIQNSKVITINGANIMLGRKNLVDKNHPIYK
jgi:hypothetical protein